ncbi:MAG TPA: glycosyl hydrolase family 28-related protein [Pyrinomonadaceae bacterium]|nr:glycosyl hydrolase family 28-related protein [Pyrinomonadaceae bacterium]
MTRVSILLLLLLSPLSFLCPAFAQSQQILTPHCSGNAATDTAGLGTLMRSGGTSPAAITFAPAKEEPLCKLDDLVLPPNVTLDLTHGGVYVESGKTLTIKGPLLASDTATVFFNALPGQGTVLLAKATAARPQWWGARGDDVADDTLPIQAAVRAVPGGVVQLSAGTFLITNTIGISADNTQLVGSGFYSSVIHCNPATERPCIDIAQRSGMISFVGIRDLGLLSTNLVRKTGIRIADATEVFLDNVKLNGIVSANKESVGLELRGRQLQTFRNVTITADRPISIEDDPNTIYDADQYHFENLYLVANPAQPCISVASGVNLSNVTLDGYQSWIQCKHGFYFRDTNTTNIAFGVTIKNARWEQNTDDDGYFIFLNHNTRLDGLILENLYGGGVHGRGLYLRKVSTATITNFQYQGRLEVLNLDATDRHFVFVNPAWGNGTLTLEGFTDYESLPRGALSKTRP